MVSRRVKRTQYVSENDYSTSEDSGSEYNSDAKNKSTMRKPTRTPKCFSKNALMARENRLRKKLYIESLERKTTQLQSENKKFNTVVKNQSNLIDKLKNEVKYLKSVLANSKDIGNLICNIRNSTGMSATTSLSDKPLKNDNFCSVNQKPIARKVAHPWHEQEEFSASDFASFPTPESSNVFSSPDHGFLDDILLKDDINFDEDLFPNELLNEDFIKNDNSALVSLEHNYTAKDLEDHDVGVCLHVSKHRVSLEFCSSCSENAAENWLS